MIGWIILLTPKLNKKLGPDKLSYAIYFIYSRLNNLVYKENKCKIKLKAEFKS